MVEKVIKPSKSFRVFVCHINQELNLIRPKYKTEYEPENKFGNESPEKDLRVPSETSPVSL
jgi:hypothetical protein